MLNATNIKSIYEGHVNQASQERQQRAVNAAADIIGDFAKAAAAGQRVIHVKENDISRDILWPVKDQLIAAGFKVKTHLRNGYQTIIISF